MGHTASLFVSEEIGPWLKSAFLALANRRN
jgi:hypothetical protein